MRRPARAATLNALLWAVLEKERLWGAQATSGTFERWVRSWVKNEIADLESGCLFTDPGGQVLRRKYLPRQALHQRWRRGNRTPWPAGVMPPGFRT